MKYDTKNSFGKRMVKEAKIKEIGQNTQEYYSSADNFIVVDNNSMKIGFSIVNGSNIVLDTTQSEPYLDLNDDIDIDSVTIDNLTIEKGANEYSVYCSDTTLPVVVSNAAGGFVRIAPDGEVSIATVDSATSTQVTFVFKTDGIYIGNTKITN